MKTSLIIEARDRASAALNRIRQSGERMGGGFNSAERAAGRMGLRIGLAGNRVVKSISKAHRFVKGFHTELKQSGFYSDLAIRGMKKTGRGFVNLGKKIAGTTLKYAKWGVAIGVGATLFAAKNTFQLAVRFEELSMALEDVEKSSRVAQRGLKWVRDYSINSVIPIEDLTNAYVEMRKIGIDPTNGSLKIYSDKAIEAKKSVTEIVKAIEEVKNGDFGSLSDLGIEASVKKGVVAFSFLNRQGQRQTREAANNARDTERVINQIFKLQSLGKAEKKLRSFSGLWQQIKNTGTGFQLDIADAGIFDKIKEKAEQILNKIKGWAKDGTLEKWAGNISEKLEEAVDWGEKFIVETDWKGVANDLKNIASAASSVADAIMGIANAGKEIANIPQLIGETDARIGNWFREKGFKGTGDIYDSIFGVDNDDRKRAGVPLVNPTRAKPEKKRKKKSNKTASVGGTIDINIKTDKGVTARTSKLASNNDNVPINVGFVGQA